MLPLHPRLSDSQSCSIWGNHCTPRSCAASNYSRIPTFSAVSLHHSIQSFVSSCGYLCPQQDASGGPRTSFDGHGRWFLEHGTAGDREAELTPASTPAPPMRVSCYRRRVLFPIRCGANKTRELEYLHFTTVLPNDALGKPAIKIAAGNQRAHICNEPFGVSPGRGFFGTSYINSPNSD
jgi:hypothetical protein